MKHKIKCFSPENSPLYCFTCPVKNDAILYQSISELLKKLIQLYILCVIIYKYYERSILRKIVGCSKEEQTLKISHKYEMFIKSFSYRMWKTEGQNQGSAH